MSRREFLLSAVPGRVLLTHAARWDKLQLVSLAPATEIKLLTDPAEFWRQFQTSRFHDYAQQSSRVPVEPLLNVKPVAPGERLAARCSAAGPRAGDRRIDALRWYWGDDNLRLRARRVLGDAVPKWMPMAETVEKKLPEWLAAVSNTRVIVSRTGAAFRGRFKSVQGLWITHYHDDRTDYAQEAAAEFQCPVYACAESDSFTPSGVDDYCLQNRNILGPGAGLLECLRLIGEKHPGAMLVNQRWEGLVRV